MSFAATAALLALAEGWPHRSPDAGTPLGRRLLGRGRDWLVAGAAVSLVAGLATDPFAIQHFNRVTLWGLPANLATELLSSLVIMPALALGVAGEAAGAGGAPLAVAGWGLDGLVAVARVFAAAPHAVVTVASAPAAALPVSFLGLLLVCLWRGRLRWLGAGLFIAVWAWPRAPAPAVWIAPEGANLAVAAPAATGRGQAVLARPASQRFAFELWARRRGLAFPAADDPRAAAAADARFVCARSACLPRDPADPALWYGLKPAPAQRVQQLCAAAALVVLRSGAMPPLTQAPACRGRVVLDAVDLARGGAAELWRAPGGCWRVRWAQADRGDRRWTAAGGLSDSGG